MPNSLLSAIWHFAFEILATEWRHIAIESFFILLKHYETQSPHSSLYLSPISSDYVSYHIHAGCIARLRYGHQQGGHGSDSTLRQAH